MTIGIIGYGFVGKAITFGFEDTHDIYIYDKYQDVGCDLDKVLKLSDVIFVCLPTPFNDETIHIDLSIYDEVIEEICSKVDNQIFVIKSTVVPGTTKRYQEMYPNNHFVFNPEFLTEKHFRRDFINSSRVVLGGDTNTVNQVEKLYRQNPHFKKTPIIKMSTTEAEIVKYQANITLATRVAVSNVFYDVCKALGEDYEKVQEAVALDQRIGPSHLTVTEERGFGGKCLESGTTIRMKNKQVPVDDIKVGDLVFDGDGFTKVTYINPRVVKESVKICGRGRHITGSKDHIHMIYKDGELIEKELQNINKGEYIFIPQQPNSGISSVNIGPKPNGYVKWWPEVLKITPQFARLIGLYLAEGCSSTDKYSTIWSFGGHEEKLADETVEILKGVGLHSKKKKQFSKNGTFGPSNCWIVRCRSMGLQEVFKKLELGTNAHNKKAPLLSRSLSKHLIGGWLEGDGSYVIKGIDTMLLSLGINASIDKHGKCIKISMRDSVKKVCNWVKRFTFNSNNYKRSFPYQSPNMRKVKNGWAIKISKVETLGERKVFTLETESHLYVANNILTHNCFVKDLGAIIGKANDLGVDADLLEEVYNYNVRIRSVKDWKDIPGATVGGKDYE
jgi:UDPglucose 6-dehydrogenase